MFNLPKFSEDELWRSTSLLYVRIGSELLCDVHHACGPFPPLNSDGVPFLSELHNTGGGLGTVESNTSEQWKITGFIAYFWHHNWIV